MSRYRTQPRNDGSIQWVQLKKRFPQFTAHWNRGCYIFRGTLHPTETSPFYELRIIYAVDNYPKVYVLAPEINQNAPHRYKDNSLCLFHPKNFDWTNQCLLSNYTIPWTAAWLRFYEIWLNTGEWFADEEPHDTEMLLSHAA